MGPTSQHFRIRDEVDDLRSHLRVVPLPRHQFWVSHQEASVRDVPLDVVRDAIVSQPQLLRHVNLSHHGFGVLPPVRAEKEFDDAASCSEVEEFSLGGRNLEPVIELVVNIPILFRMSWIRRRVTLLPLNLLDLSPQDVFGHLDGCLP